MIQIIGSLLLVYSWVVAAVLVFFLFLIGRFYEIKIKQKSYYRLFLVPLVLFVAAALWVTLAYRRPGNPGWDFVGAVGPDLLFLVGGLFLIGLCYSLYRLMTARKR